MSELEHKTLMELKQMAKENNIKNISKLKKEELINILEQINQKSENNIIEENTNNFENKKYDYADEDSEEENELGVAESEISYQINNEEDEIIEGILDVLPDGYGFLRGDNFLSTPKDIYISPVQIRRFKLETGDLVKGIARCKEGEKFPSLIFVGEVNGEHPEKAIKRKRFDELTPIHLLNMQPE